ncbi:hypothetical protein CLG96_03225 [Sphingomonas oleivorans]|uniref:Uncharacterized protein n=1 Tax=Sphingomonas oleivorans TaxID=1735121 RepID=A0A2T5G1Y6_9SPHN|nr:hypothetical protein CLG96_03225 [Sphingomonas oleivorans]
MAIALSTGTTAQAEPAEATNAPAAIEAEQASPFAEATPISTRQLGMVTGQADLAQEIRAQNNSTVSRNVVSGNSVTGTINFDDQAFQNLNGLSVLNANTGNNVAINASMNVNVSLQP